MEVVVLTLVFVGTLLLMVGVYAFVNRRSLSTVEAMRARMAGVAPSAIAVNILRDDRVSGLGFLNRLLAGRPVTGTLGIELQRAGSRQSVGEFVLLTVFAAAVGLMLGQRFLGLAGAAVSCALGGVVPWVLLKRKQAKRMARFEEQLPDAIDMLVNALKAGYSLQAAMEFVGKEVPDPLGPEFARFYDQQRLGVEVRTALLGLQDRVGTADVKMFVTSLLIQRETGGNLGEVLTNLATLMRERVAFRGLVRTLTAEPKLSARILALLPVGIFLILSSLNREYMKPLWTTPGGRLMVMYSLISIIIGYIAMSKLGEVEI